MGREHPEKFNEMKSIRYLWPIFWVRSKLDRWISSLSLFYQPFLCQMLRLLSFHDDCGGSWKGKNVSRQTAVFSASARDPNGLQWGGGNHFFPGDTLLQLLCSSGTITATRVRQSLWTGRWFPEGDTVMPQLIMLLAWRLVIVWEYFVAELTGRRPS